MVRPLMYDYEDGTSVAPLLRIASDPRRAESLHGLIGDFCHLVRNRLNSLQMSLYLARREVSTTPDGTWDELDRHYREAERVIEQFQMICRPMSLRPVTIGLDLVLDDVIRRWTARFAARGITLVCESPGPGLLVSLDPTRLGQGMDALAGWRVEQAAAETVIRLGGRIESGRVQIFWRESNACRAETGGDLALATLSRVVTAHDGKLRREHREGWSVWLDWPQTVPEPPLAKSVANLVPGSIGKGCATPSIARR